ncbi:MAG: C40 family peptidase [Acidimicrobiales bacterium]
MTRLLPRRAWVARSVVATALAVAAVAGPPGVAGATAAGTAAPGGPAAGAGAAARPAAGAAGAAAAGKPVPPAIPTVPLSDTDGQAPSALLARALTLAAAGHADAPLAAALGLVSSRLDAASIAARQAASAAARARTDFLAASERLSAAKTDLTSLGGALTTMAVRMYETDSGGLDRAGPLLEVNQWAWRSVYAANTVNPQGILAQRRGDLSSAQAAAARSRADLDQANQAAARAAAAAAIQDVQRTQLGQELSTLGTQDAAALGAERTSLAQDVGAYAAGTNSLQFTPAAPLIPQVATVDIALEWAFSELGKPYVWGATGPATFDCSGFTQYVWHAAGVDIPRVAADQDAWTIPVPLSQLMPGDLVFYGTTDIHHVGMYIGDGLMINSPDTGSVVSVSSIWWSDLNGFGRVHAAGVPVPPHIIPTPVAPVTPPLVAAPGPVPSQTKPPAGWKAAPGKSAPLPGYGAELPPGLATTTTTTTGGRGTTTTTKAGTGPATTTLGPATTTTVVPGPATATTSTSTSTTGPGGTTTTTATTVASRTPPTS